MPLIDEEGNLFGVINVIDALVLVVVVFVVLAGVGLVLNDQRPANESDTEPEPLRYATLSYTVPLESTAAHIDQGDELTPTSGGDAFEVVSVYRSFTPNGSAHIVARVTYRGTATDNSGQLYGGDTTALSTGTYRVTANVLAVNQSSATLQTHQESVVLTANVSDAAREAIEPGQQATIGNTTVATIRSVTEQSRSGDRRQVYVGVDLTVWDRGPISSFDGQALRVDNPVTVVTDTVVIRGRIYTVGTTGTTVNSGSNETSTRLTP